MTPIPYKLVTITSGFAGYNLLLFIVFSIITRGPMIVRDLDVLVEAFEEVGHPADAGLEERDAQVRVPFERALEQLIEWTTGRQSPADGTAIMCAEAVWWRCHRQLISDALVARGIEVRHISSATSAPPHALTAFARVEGGRVTYPGLI